MVDKVVHSTQLYTNDIELIKLSLATGSSRHYRRHKLRVAVTYVSVSYQHFVQMFRLINLDCFPRIISFV